MKFSFKKIGSVLASTAMLTSTVALAAAANFPAPFVAGGAANVAIVHGGADAAYTDLVAVTDVTSYLATKLAEATTTGGTATTDTVTGEAAPLFTSGTKLYLNDSLNLVRNVLTKSQLPTVLADGSFSGNVDATISHTIEIGSWPTIKYAKEPTSSYDPEFGLSFSSDQANYLYNATATFSKTVNLTHADSIGEDLTLFGQTYTIASATTGADLVLLKSAERVSLSNEDPVAEVTIAGEKYTVTLVSTSDTTATVKVTDSAGASSSKEVSENQSKKIGKVTVAVINADENNLLLSATIVIGAEKVTLTSGNQVRYGEENKAIDGTLVTLGGSVPGLTKVTISTFASTSDADFLKPGEAFVDPTFGSFKLDFSGLNIPVTDTANREDIKIGTSGDDKMTLSFTDHRDKAITALTWAINRTVGLKLEKDSEGRNITVLEMAPTYDEEYVVLGNEDDAYLLRVNKIYNDSATSTEDYVDFTDVISGDTYTTAKGSSTEGSLTLNLYGNDYTVKYIVSPSNTAEANRYVRVNMPASSTNKAVLYPSIETSKGAKLMFYKPVTIALNNWDLDGNNLSALMTPDGDGYGSDITFSDIRATNYSVLCGATSVTSVLNATATNVGCAIGKITYNITGSTTSALIGINNPATNTKIVDPSLIIFEEKDDNTEYQALVVTLDDYSSSSDKIGIDDVVRTWSLDGAWDALALQTDSKITKDADLWGTVTTIDGTASDQKVATISYPGEQVTAGVYVASQDASITGGSSTTSGGTGVELGSVSVTDAEASSVATKNLIVIGGSCVNSVAAELLGVTNPTCGEGFTTATGVNSGQYLIETFSRTGGKVATLVAGYNAGDTTNAAKALITKTIDTTVGKKYTGTTATDVTAVVTTPVTETA